MDANAASLSFTAAPPRHFEVNTSPDAVKVQRRGSVPFTPAPGPKSRTNTGPSSVMTDVPAIVQTSVGTTRAVLGDQGDTASVAPNENVAPETVAQDVTAGTDGKPGKARRNGHSRKPSIFDMLSFKRSKSTVEARQAGANTQGPTPRTEQRGVVLASNIEELTAKELARDAKTDAATAPDAKAQAVAAEQHGEPDSTLMLVKAEEMEATPLDSENRPPLEGDKAQKKGRSGRFLSCISPRTKDD